MQAWPTKRRVEKAFSELSGSAELRVQFQPFQLYPELPEEGIDKQHFFAQNSKRVRPDETESERDNRRQRVVAAWSADGLQLLDVYGSLGGRVGNSLDAQRLILLAREQGCEDACIEAIYTSNHVHGCCLSDRTVLLAAAATAGVLNAEQTLFESDYGKQEVLDKIESYRAIGLSAVPVVILNDRFVIRGAPTVPELRDAFTQLLELKDD